MIDVSRRGLWLLTGILGVAGLLLAYLNYAYFFNPITFRSNAVLNLPWQSYRNPLQLEYAVLDDDGWKITTTSDPAEIDLVFRELSRGETVSELPPQPGSRPIWFGVRRQSDGTMLLSIDGQEDCDSCRLESDRAIRLTAELQELLDRRLAEARNVAARRKPSPIET